MTAFTQVIQIMNKILSTGRNVETNMVYNLAIGLHISLCVYMLDCNDQYCSVQKDEIVDLYKFVVNALLLPVTTFLLLLLVQLK